jgi:hypothetical protein
LTITVQTMLMLDLREEGQEEAVENEEDEVEEEEEKEVEEVVHQEKRTNMPMVNKDRHEEEEVATKRGQIDKWINLPGSGGTEMKRDHPITIRSSARTNQSQNCQRRSSRSHRRMSLTER